MDMNPTDIFHPTFISNITGAVFFLLLMILLLINWRGQLIGGILLYASSVSTLWLGLMSYDYLSREIGSALLHNIELMRNVSWLTLLVSILSFGLRDKETDYTDIRFTVYLIGINILIAILLSTNVAFGYFSVNVIGGMPAVYFVFLVLSIFSLTLLEKIYKNTRSNKKWNIKYLCLGLGVVFSYDFFLYSDAMLFKSIDVNLWDTRGFINALAVPLIAVTAVRNPQWDMQIFVSRHVVYRSVVVIGTGIYLLVMAATGFYVKKHGGTWGNSLQLFFFVGALIILFVLMASEQIRNSVKVILVKHFYQNKYDYREEWLNFTNALSAPTVEENPYEVFISSICQIIKTNGAGLWLRDDKKSVFFAKSFYGNIPQVKEELPVTHPIIDFMEVKNWVIELDEERLFSSVEDIPDWILKIPDIWLMLPLILNNKIIGFMLFQKSAVKHDFDWEDADLLKTVAFQTSSFLTIMQLTESLSEAKQFEAFNRLSAFVVHDIKNLIAQLSLISTNAVNFRDNQEFIDDSFDTIASATDRMKKLLRNLSKGELSKIDNNEQIKLNDLIKSIVNSRNSKQVTLGNIDYEKYSTVLVDKDKLTSVFEHLLQNAEDAVSEAGYIIFNILYQTQSISVEVVDNGIGMEQEFIDNRLFKPFDTTKGNAGMGIGLYESREYLSDMNGNITVESKPQQGTKFTVTLPLFQSNELTSL